VNILKNNEGGNRQDPKVFFEKNKCDGGGSPRAIIDILEAVRVRM